MEGWSLEAVMTFVTADARRLSLRMALEDSLVRVRAPPKSRAGIAYPRTKTVVARYSLLAARLTAGDIGIGTKQSIRAETQRSERGNGGAKREGASPWLVS